MKRFLPVACLLMMFGVSPQLFAQAFTDSNLPIVIIVTDNNAPIPDEPRVLGSMKIIDNGVGQRNFMADQNNASALHYNGRIKIEVRGSSSQSLDKKQYSFTTLLQDNVSNNNVSLLGMPSENDWVLNSLAFDPSLIRDYISYTLSRKIGQYAPRTEYCEVILNGVYQGLYLLQEKIKADDNRVDVIKIDQTDNTLPDLSGGYITKADRGTTAWLMSSYYGFNDVNYVHELPSVASATQTNYIQSIFQKLASKATSTSLTDGYPAVIDVPSFLDFMIINELSSNVDAYQLSTYFHKDKNGKLRAGPVWDLNLTYGNDLFIWNYDRSKPNLWQFDDGDNIGSRFWKELFNNSTYKCYMAKRWNELTQAGQPLHLTSLETLIDETVATLDEASVRELSRWQYEKSTWRTTLDLATQIADLKVFLSSRISWMTSRLGSFSGCSNINTPALQITRINYNPATSPSFPDSHDQEFIEITNTSDTPVNLTGLYFSGTGFVYQFTPGSVLQPHGVLQLANHRETFKLFYGFMPYDEFTRNLSDDGQKLTLADGFGNVIDEVEYSDQAPWPDADGNGSYLKLISADLDNSIPANWIASTEPISTTIVGTDDDLLTRVHLYPNPTMGSMIISADTPITSLTLRDLQGRLLKSIDTDSHTSTTLDLNNYPNGMYLLTITLNGRSEVHKIIKR